jgi:hypothetical protein
MEKVQQRGGTPPDLKAPSQEDAGGPATAGVESVSEGRQASIADLASIEFTPAAVAVFNGHGRRLDTLIQVAQSQVADLRATLRELVNGHPSGTKADVANLAKLKAILVEVS